MLMFVRIIGFRNVTFNAQQFGILITKCYFLQLYQLLYFVRFRYPW